MAPRTFSTLLPAVFGLLLLAFGSCTDKSEGLFSPANAPESIGVPNGGGPGIGSAANNAGGVPTNDPNNDGPPPEPVPEPTTILLFGAGLTTLAFYRRRRRDLPAAV